jgi:deoxyribonuclease V
VVFCRKSNSDQIAAAAVCVDLETPGCMDSATIRATADFPYTPGLLAFRELPYLLEALNQLSMPPDVLVCDRQGIAHPRRFESACHVGATTGIPTIGVGKTPLGHYVAPGPKQETGHPSSTTVTSWGGRCAPEPE